MKKMGIIYIALIILIAIWIAIKFWQPNLKKTEVLLNNEKFSIEIASSPIQWARGLMYRDNLPKNNGMLFIFPMESKQSFWMKNVKFPLDIIFLSKDKKIVDIKENFEPCLQDSCPSYTPSEKAKFVLEINGGRVKDLDLKIGDEIKMNI